ncbi:hypothetical protein [Acidibrevibacterium sp.]|uniref:hypothetical protein n=1 Tax=Acidibrevibacterium sp. TaxID=2606776 RepID=UPI003D0745FD
MLVFHMVARKFLHLGMDLRLIIFRAFLAKIYEMLLEGLPVPLREPAACFLDGPRGRLSTGDECGARRGLGRAHENTRLGVPAVNVAEAAAGREVFGGEGGGSPVAKGEQGAAPQPLAQRHAQRRQRGFLGAVAAVIAEATALDRAENKLQRARRQHHLAGAWHSRHEPLNLERIRGLLSVSNRCLIRRHALGIENGRLEI